MEHSINSISKSSSDFSHSPVQLGINRQGSLQGRQVVHNTTKTAEQIKNHINSEGLQKSSGIRKVPETSHQKFANHQVPFRKNH